VTAHDGRLVIASFAAAVSTIQYYHLDIMGSVRAVTDDAGATVERHDYKPFGEDTQTLPPPGTDPTRFVGAERDQTGLDYMGARYYSMFAGRFTSVDPVISGAAITDPQQWNRYAYARNNPLAFSDPTGTVIQPGYDCPTAACDSYNYGPDGPAIIDGGGMLSSGYDDIVTALGGDPNRGNDSTPKPPPTDTQPPNSTDNPPPDPNDNPPPPCLCAGPDDDTVSAGPTGNSFLDDSKIRALIQQAWALTGNAGQCTTCAGVQNEAGFRVDQVPYGTGMLPGPMVTTAENPRLGVNIPISPITEAIFHIHPVGGDGPPTGGIPGGASDGDQMQYNKLYDSPSKQNVLVFTISHNGITVYNPATRSTTLVVSAADVAAYIHP